MAQLLNLPAELIFLIVDELGCGDRYKLGVTCRRFSFLALPDIHSKCYMQFCNYAYTYVHMVGGPRGVFDRPDYTGFKKYGSYVKELYVNYDFPVMKLPNCNEQWLRDQARELIEERSRGTIANQLELVLPEFTTLTTAYFTSDHSAGGLRPGAGPILEIRMVRMIVRSYRSIKKLSIALDYNPHFRDDLKELETLENELNIETDSNARVSSQPRLTDVSIRLMDQHYRINLDSTYCILRMLCGVLHGPAKTVTRFSFGFSASSRYRDPLPPCHMRDNMQRRYGIDLVSTFSGLKTLALHYPGLSLWPSGILEAQKEGLVSLKELQIPMSNTYIEDETLEDILRHNDSMCKYNYKIQEIDDSSRFYYGNLGGILLTFDFDT
ncbi:hypothetical protein TWF102_007988 [Orbilia oligospora]|uniref:F-box domain-containing protein n=1 Tax=Orbilia oligospora TaxID=2813651 RepID=A0A7C8NN56_ORBOL|nr:hypothetical protein TWF102_007988 [Orbilia oligospora]KAF3108410.1 hypothetical protein TWF103_005495 [Orbilia oligospora]